MQCMELRQPAGGRANVEPDSTPVAGIADVNDAKSPAEPPVSHDEQVHRLADAFERCWQSGNRPSIDEYLDQASPPWRAALLRELVVLEVDFRRAEGEAVALDDYLRRFPEEAASVEGAFFLLAERDCLSTQSLVEKTNPGRVTKVAVQPVGMPKRLDRYEVLRVLGHGAFGTVYLCHDPQLDRRVALKVPHRKWFSSAEQMEAFVQEARTAARLKHPALVAVYDVRQHDDGLYIVQEYVDGQDLAAAIASSVPTPEHIASLIVEVAEAIGCAHQHNLVHRDLKPANILVDRQGRAHVADFGLALDEGLLRERKGEVAGTPAYMSPEQVRGETHRLDGRTDLWSLGVILYELLTGRRPFAGKDRKELFDEILRRDPKPPRMARAEIPRELERVCLRCLEKQPTQRYNSAAELADDLRQWLNHSQRPLRAVNGSPSSEGLAASGRIVPKGLQCFDARDAEFFLELLPGPYDRDGLPQAIRFWKARIEEVEPGSTFSLGVIYGPSGCGKSSLAKAGLLPRLAEHIVPIYVESTAADTELRLLKALRKHCPELPADGALPESIERLRHFGGSARRKVLLVLDQFEQWLHANAAAVESPLIAALRHCDGAAVQCIVIVRDDFWMSLTRFMHAVEIPLVEGHNSAAVDLFDPAHALKVLTAFGRAYGLLDPSPAKLTSQQSQFLERSVDGLADEGKVIGVRLALFAEMMKGRPWTPTSLEEVGGTEGVGVTFLEGTFSGKHAPPTHRLHQAAARAVLKALLPEAGSAIKGEMKSHSALLEASGYMKRPADFESLLAILEGELRLITPTEPDDTDRLQSTAPPEGKFYQLTHDYLVPSLHDWLTRKQRETRRGRAELRLNERAALWSVKPENRYLPAWWEFLGISALTSRRNWTESQRRMMRAAGRIHATRAAMLALLLIAAAWAVYEWDGRAGAKGMVYRVVSADAADLEKRLRELAPYRRWAVPLLKSIVNSPNESPQAKRNASLAMIDGHSALIDRDFLFDQLIEAPAEDVAVVSRLVSSFRPELTERLWKAVEAPAEQRHRLRAAAALAVFAPNDARWSPWSAEIAGDLVSVPALEIKSWTDNLYPIGGKLTRALESIFKDRRPEWSNERAVAATALARYHSHHPERLANLAVLADNDKEFLPFVEQLQGQRARACFLLHQILHDTVAAEAEERDRDAHWRKQANAAVCLVQLGRPEEVWPYLRDSPDPSLRSFLIQRFHRLGTAFNVLAKQLEVEEDPAVRQGLILSLGEFDALRIGTSEQRAATQRIARLYCRDPDSGVHSAAEWALRNWKASLPAIPCDATPKKSPAAPSRNRTWFNNSRRQTFAVIAPSPDRVATGDAKSPPPAVSHRFAISIHEIAVRDFQEFREDYRPSTDFVAGADCPANNISWYQAAEYCNWLSAQEGIPKEQWCYVPDDQGRFAEGMTIPADSLRRTGYRLPTAAEWECACRAGTQTSYSFGEPLELLKHFAWFMDNSENRLRPVGQLLPNAIGAFDMHGNVAEWIHDAEGEKTTEGVEPISNNQNRHLRGGSFIYQSSALRSAVDHSDAYRPNSQQFYFGFRLARSCP